ncbi:MAG TPA: hypothetical protein VIY53_01040 [Acidobacteriaceae bacterium]
MQRQPWFEIHDSSRFPKSLRDRVTEALEAVWNANQTYRPIAGRLRAALQQAGTHCVVDLCSGGGGPWPSLYPELADGEPLTVRLTDRSPSDLLAGGGAHGRLEPVPDSVDARAVPPSLHGFRTIFSSFHHFNPPEARAMLEDAFRQREGIAIFEAARRDAATMALLIGVPVLGWRTAVAARPVRWNRLFWTCVVPVVPLVLWIDGILSCLRSYSLDDMRELTEGLEAADYAWQIGEEKSGRVAIRYLIGTPLRACSASSVSSRPASSELSAARADAPR